MAESVVPLPSISRPPTGQPPRKLRDSCIHCANSKVKCNKEKPICGRCVRRRLPCEYKVSRRTGRTSRAATQAPGASSAATPSSTLRLNKTNPSPNISKDAIAGVAPAQPTLLAPATTIPSTQSSPEHYVSHTPDLWHSILSPSDLGPDVGDLSSLMPLGADVGDLFTSVIPSPQFNLCDLDTLPPPGLSDTLSVTEQPLLTAQGLSDTKFFDLSSTTTKPPACCLTIVLNILTSLFPNAPAACQRPGTQAGTSGVRTLESVISDNRKVVDTVNTVLDCPCSQDEYIISIVSLAIFKVMGWYVAAARDRTPMSDDTMSWSGDLTCHSDRESPASLDEQVLHLPSVVGNYCIDGSDQSRMAAQLVLSELHRVQRLVNVVSSRLESIRLRACLSSGSSAGPGAVDSGEISLSSGIRLSPFSGATLSHLEEDLRRRLRSISSETIEILRRA